MQKGSKCNACKQNKMYGLGCKCMHVTTTLDMPKPPNLGKSLITPPQWVSDFPETTPLLTLFLLLLGTP